MGVMSCSRKDCDNIMCDVYISDVGYICYDCENEFKETINCDEEMSHSFIIKKLNTFMETSKEYGSNETTTVDELFRKSDRNYSEGE